MANEQTSSTTGSPASGQPARPFKGRLESPAAHGQRPGLLIVAFGDSVTQGCTALGRQEPDHVYHQRLKRLLEARYPERVFSVINSGIGGDSTAGALARVDRDVTRYRPDLVLVAFGLNDAWGGREDVAGFRERLSQIVGRIQSEIEAEVILLTPSFMCTGDHGPVAEVHRELLPKMMAMQNDGILAEYAQAIHDVGRERQVKVADVYAAWAQLAGRGVDTTAMLSNGLNHPTGEAHAIAAECVLKAIEAE